MMGVQCFAPTTGRGRIADDGGRIRIVPPFIRDGKLLLFGRVAPDGPVNAKFVRVALAGELKDAPALDVLLDCGGGDLREALRVYIALQAAGKPVHIRIDGQAASMGAVIAMAADQLEITCDSAMLLHLPALRRDEQTEMRLTAPVLRKTADVLDNDTETITDIFCRRTKRPRDQVSAMLSSETVLSAEAAVELGLADSLAPDRRPHACPHCGQVQANQSGQP